MQTVLIILICFLCFASSASSSNNIIINIHTEDDPFRTNDIRKFEERYINKGVILDHKDIKLNPNNLLSRYYLLIESSSTIDHFFIAELTKIAADGLYVAMINLGDIYSMSTSKFSNPDLAIKWFTQAVEQKNSPHSLVRLGFAYEKILNNKRKAIDLYSKGCMKDYANACFNLGIVSSQNGSDISDVIVALEKAHKLGHPKSGKDLYVIYKSLGRNEAISYLQDSADRGYNEAQYFLGVELFHKKNISTGLQYIEISAENEFIPAQYFLGLHYSKKIKSKSDFEVAEKWYLKAAIAGDETARMNLLSLYNIYEKLIPEITKKRQKFIDSISSIKPPKHK